MLRHIGKYGHPTRAGECFKGSGGVGNGGIGMEETVKG